MRLDPFGRGFLNIFYDLADRNRSGQVEKQVGVVLHGIDKNRSASEILQDGGHVGVQCVADGIGDDGFAVLRAEDEVNMERASDCGMTWITLSGLWVDGWAATQGVALG